MHQAFLEEGGASEKGVQGENQGGGNRMPCLPAGRPLPWSRLVLRSLGEAGRRPPSEASSSGARRLSCEALAQQDHAKGMTCGALSVVEGGRVA